VQIAESTGPLTDVSDVSRRKPRILALANIVGANAAAAAGDGVAPNVQLVATA